MEAHFPKARPLEFTVMCAQPPVRPPTARIVLPELHVPPGPCFIENVPMRPCKINVNVNAVRLRGVCTLKRKRTLFKTLKKKQLAFSSNDVSKDFNKLDAPHLVLITILSCALVVGR